MISSNCLTSFQTGNPTFLGLFSSTSHATTFPSSGRTKAILRAEYPVNTPGKYHFYITIIIYSGEMHHIDTSFVHSKESGYKSYVKLAQLCLNILYYIIVFTNKTDKIGFGRWSILVLCSVKSIFWHNDTPVSQNAVFNGSFLFNLIIIWDSLIWVTQC